MTGSDIQSMIWSAVDWIIFSIGLQLVLKKLGEKKCWLAWVPGIRFFKLGQALGMGAEGVLCGSCTRYIIMTGINTASALPSRRRWSFWSCSSCG